MKKTLTFIIVVILGGIVLYLFTKDTSACSKLTTESDRENCYKQEAVSESNILICKKIKRNDGVNGCFISYATATKDVSVCDSVDWEFSFATSKQGCYGAVAAATNNPSVCAKSSLDYAHVCYTKVASQNKNLDACLNIINEEGKRDYCYRQVAFTAHDPAICNYIENNTYKHKELCLKGE